MRNIAFTLAFFILSSTVVSGFFYSVYVSSKQSLQSTIEGALIQQNKLLTLELNSDKIQRLMNDNHVDGDALYTEIIAPLRRQHNVIRNQIRYVYTVHEKQGKFLFGVDTAPKTDEDKDGQIDHSDLNSIYDKVPRAAIDALKDKELRISDEPYTDNWGTFISAYSPLIASNGETAGVLGTDISLDTFLAQTRQLRNKLLFSWSLFEVLIILLSYLGYNYKESRDREERALIEKKAQEISLIQAGKLTELGMISASIAHEMSTPLSIISMQSMRLKTLNDMSKLPAISDKLEAAVRRMTDTIKSMKNFIRINRDQMEITTIDSLMKSTIQLIGHHIASIKFEWINETNPELFCFPNQINQVLINLIMNAFQEHKGDPEAWIKVHSFTDGNMLRIEITDSGLGIPEEQLKKIYLGFFSTKDSGEGAGMGLLISRRIIENHKGRLEYLKDRPNTTFLISLPIESEKQHEDHAG